MRGIVFKGAQKLEIMQFDDPMPGPGEAIIEMKASGMCGNDLHPYRGNPVAFIKQLGLKDPEARGIDPRRDRRARRRRHPSRTHRSRGGIRCRPCHRRPDGGPGRGSQEADLRTPSARRIAPAATSRGSRASAARRPGEGSRWSRRAGSSPAAGSAWRPMPPGTTWASRRAARAWPFSDHCDACS